MGRLLEGFVEAIANAIGDIRQKVVEEPWFGRAVTPPPETTDLGWTTHAERMAQGREHTFHSHEHDHGRGREPEIER